MPYTLNRATEAALSDLFDTAFMSKLKKYLGYDPDTPADDIPVDITDLLTGVVSQIETEQWRNIRAKEVTLTLPYRAFCRSDRMLFLPFGPLVAAESGDDIVITYLDTDDETQTITQSSYRVYEGEPIRLWCEDWASLFTNVKTDDPYPVTVVYTAGYSAYSDIPYTTINAIKILCYHLNTYREAIDKPMPVPAAYVMNRDHALLNDHRALTYLIDDNEAVAPR